MHRVTFKVKIMLHTFWEMRSKNLNTLSSLEPVNRIHPLRSPPCDTTLKGHGI